MEATGVCERRAESDSEDAGDAGDTGDSETVGCGASMCSASVCGDCGEDGRSVGGSRYSCVTCGFHTPYKTSYTRHLGTAKHHRNTKAGECAFSCKPCGFYTDNRYKYKRHLGTQRHQRNTGADASLHVCQDCGSTFHHYSSLCRHRKACKIGSIIDRADRLLDEIKAQPAAPAVVQNVSVGTVNNTVNNNLYIENFLNTNCADAPNISDFIDSIEISLGELVDMSEKGFTESASSIIMDRMESMDIAVRPIHCTNKRTKMMYIRECNEWNPDPKHEHMNRAITQLHRKEMERVFEYEDNAPPDHFKDDKRFIEKNNMIMKLSDYGPSREKIVKGVVARICEGTYTPKRELLRVGSGGEAE